MTDADRADKFMQTWGLDDANLRVALLALIQDVRDEADDTAFPASAVDLPNMTAALGRVPARAQEVLIRLAPPGTPVTDTLKAEVRREVSTVVLAELTESGIRSDYAKLVAGLFAFAVQIKEKV